MKIAAAITVTITIIGAFLLFSGDHDMKKTRQKTGLALFAIGIILSSATVPQAFSNK